MRLSVYALYVVRCAVLVKTSCPSTVIILMLQYAEFWVQVLPFEEYVFNTEAHPLPIFGTDLEQSHMHWYLTAPPDQNEPIGVDKRSLLQFLDALKGAW